jgi:hypothetical protein
MLSEEIKLLVEVKKVVEECFDPFEVISPMFVLFKGNKKRPVWDGRYIN